MKNMSFGKIVGLFAGSMVALMLLVAVIMKMSTPQISENVVLKKHSISPQVEAHVDTTAQTNQKLLLAQKQAQEAAQQTIAQQAAVLQSQRTQQELIKKIDEMTLVLAKLNDRVVLLETQKVVEIPKSRKTAYKHITERRYALPASSGYKAMATVGDRAWIAADTNEDSVTPGQTLPPKPALRVRAVDSESGIVITTHDPH